MTVNEGTIDRVLRVIVGLGLIALALGYIPGMAATPLGWIGVVPLARQSRCGPALAPVQPTCRAIASPPGAIRRWLRHRRGRRR